MAQADLPTAPGEEGDEDAFNDAPIPFEPSTASVKTLLRFAMDYRNDEPRLSQVMPELMERDFSPYDVEVRALQWRWQYLVRCARPLRWPDTAVALQSQAFGGRLFECGADGMLSFFGYHVGETSGLIMSVRRDILDYIYRGNLPLVSDAAYTQSWGPPASPQRLKKLAMTLSHLARNALAKENPNYETAISEWEADLKYIKSMCYRPYDNLGHRWEWPEIRIY
jgi:hypothetical protein